MKSLYICKRLFQHQLIMRKIFVSLLLILSWSLCSQEPLKIAVISDTHYLSSKLALPGSALDKYEATTGRVINDLHAVLHKVIFDLQSYNPDILLIPGDITNHGERESHIDFVNIMKPLANNGTRIFVIPGNHDVNVPNSKSMRVTHHIPFLVYQHKSLHNYMHHMDMEMLLNGTLHP